MRKIIINIIQLNNPTGVGGVETTFLKLATYFAQQGDDVTVICKKYETTGCLYQLNDGYSIKDYEKNEMEAMVIVADPDVFIVHFSGVNGLELLNYENIARKGIAIIAQECTNPTRSIAKLANVLKCSVTQATLYRELSINVATSCRFVLEDYKRSVSAITGSQLVGFNNPYAKINNTKQMITDRKGTKIVSIGSYKASKEPLTLLNAFSRAKRHYHGDNDWKLHIFGKQPSNKLLPQIAHLHNDVIFHGIETNKHKIYADADIHLLASKSEGNSNTVCEATTYGVPSVAFDVDGVKQNIEDESTGLLAKELTSEALAEKLLMLMTDADARKKMSESCVDYADKYSEEIVYAEWDDLVNSTMANNKKLYATRMLNLQFLLNKQANLTQPKVSIVVPLHNKESTIEKCLNSLLMQTLSDIEVLVVDDYSTDGSLGLVYKLMRGEKRIKVLKNSFNVGLMPTRKIGYLAASGDYIISCDADDCFETNFTQRLYEYAILHDADIVQGTAYVVDALTNEISEHPCRSQPLAGHGIDHIHLLLANEIKPSMCHKIIKRELAHEIYDSFDETCQALEDLYTSFYLLLKTEKYLYNPEIRGYYYYAHPGQRSKTLTTNMVRNRVTSLLKMLPEFEASIEDIESDNTEAFFAFLDKKRNLYNKHVKPHLGTTLAEEEFDLEEIEKFFNKKHTIWSNGYRMIGLFCRKLRHPKKHNLSSIDKGQEIRLLKRTYRSAIRAVKRKLLPPLRRPIHRIRKRSLTFYYRRSRQYAVRTVKFILPTIGIDLLKKIRLRYRALKGISS